MHRRLLVAALAALFFVPSVVHASATPKLKIYTKKFKRIVGAGTITNIDAVCKDGDYAIAGHWVAGEVTSPGFDNGDIVQLVSRPSPFASGGGIWDSTFQNNTPDDVKETVLETCLKHSTAGGKPAHELELSAVMQDEHDGLALGPHEFDHSSPCPAGSIPVAAGFNAFQSGSGRSYRLWTTNDLQGTHFAGIVTTAPASIILSHRCLNLKTSSADWHQHDLVTEHVAGFAGEVRHLTSGAPDTESLACGEDETSTVNYSWITDPDHVLPAGDTSKKADAAFTYVFDGSGDDSVYLDTLCINRFLTPAP